MKLSKVVNKFFTPALSIGVLVLTRPSQAVNIIQNGSFENGFTSWITKDMTNPFFPLQTVGAGVNPGFGIFNTQPTDGSFAAVHGFDGDGKDIIEIKQAVQFGGCATLSFDWRAGWIFNSGTMSKTFNVVIESGCGGAVLNTFAILTADPVTRHATKCSWFVVASLCPIGHSSFAPHRLAVGLCNPDKCHVVL